MFLLFDDGTTSALVQAQVRTSRSSRDRRNHCLISGYLLAIFEHQVPLVRLDHRDCFVFTIGDQLAFEIRVWTNYLAKYSPDEIITRAAGNFHR